SAFTATSATTPPRVSSSRRRARNSGRGSARNSAATPSNSAMLGSRLAIAASGSVSKTSTAQSSCSINSGLDILAPHLGAQPLQRAKLQLLDGSIAASHFLSDLANASLIDEAAQNHMALIERKSIDQLEQHRALFD